MQITNLKKNKNNDRISVELDGEFAFSVSIDLCLEYRLKQGEEIDEETAARIREENEKQRAVEAMTGLLNYGMHSQSDMRRRLKTKKFSNEAIEYAMDLGQRYGMVDDRELAEGFAQSRMRLHGWGPAKIKSALYQKGIPGNIIEEVVSEIFDTDVQLEQAAAAGMKKAPQITRKTADPREWKWKMQQFLMQRGFSGAVSAQVSETLLIHCGPEGTNSQGN